MQIPHAMPVHRSELLQDDRVLVRGGAGPAGWLHGMDEWHGRRHATETRA